MSRASSTVRRLLHRSRGPKPPRPSSVWARRDGFISMPAGATPMTRLAGSQAERFGVAVVPFDRESPKSIALPSFAYKAHESRRTMRDAAKYGGTLRVLEHDKKHDGYAFAKAVGVQVPEIIHGGIAFDRLDWSALPDRFVVKPVRGAASRGVFLLEREGPDKYRNHMDSTVVTSAEVIATYDALVHEKAVSRNAIVEELLAPAPSLRPLVSIPDDLKVFTFYDHPAVIMQRRCFGTTDASQFRFRFWDAEWNDLGAVKYEDRIDPAMAPPEAAEEVLEVVRRLGAALAVPFARIDVYESDHGVVFGEITPHPGPLAGWRADLDRLLGHEWEIAQARLAVEGKPTIIPVR